MSRQHDVDSMTRTDHMWAKKLLRASTGTMAFSRRGRRWGIRFLRYKYH